MFKYINSNLLSNTDTAIYNCTIHAFSSEQGVDNTASPSFKSIIIYIYITSHYNLPCFSNTFSDCDVSVCSKDGCSLYTMLSAIYLFLRVSFLEDLCNWHCENITTQQEYLIKGISFEGWTSKPENRRGQELCWQCTHNGHHGSMPYFVQVIARLSKPSDHRTEKDNNHFVETYLIYDNRCG